MCMSCKLWSINYFYLSINILESFQVGAIIAKLRPSWNNYRKKLLNMSKDLTLEEFGQHLRIKEEIQVRNYTNSDSEVNVNNVQSGSSSNLVRPIST